MRTWLLPIIPLLFVTACDSDINGIDSCQQRRNFERFAGISSTLETRIVSDAGAVRVIGRSGINDIRVVGRGCASRSRDLDDMELIAQRMNGYVRVLALVPGGNRARMDITVEVPDWMLVEVDGLNGDIDVENVSGLIVINEWGDVKVRNIFGDVEIEDGPGHIDVRRVDGDVWLWDGSGNIYVNDVLGNLYIEEDTSGRLEYYNIRGVVRRR